MELIPKEIKEQIPKLYDTEDQKDPIVFLFNLLYEDSLKRGEPSRRGV